MTPRIRPTRLAAADLGLSYTAFLALRADSAFPKPIHERGHHLYWDMKAIENYFDKAANLVPDSYRATNRIAEALRGGNQSALP